MTTLKVATINLRNRQDQWLKRRHLLVGQLIDAAPDLISLQEVDWRIAQGRWIRGQINARLGRENERPYHIAQCRNPLPFQGYPFGLGILSRYPIVYHEKLNLEYGGRMALRANIRLPGNRSLDFVATHLHSNYKTPEIRLEQAMLLTGWLNDHKWVPAQIIAGDFNDLPRSEAIRYVKQQFRSVYELKHHHEPYATYPTALVPVKRPFDGAHVLGWSGCLDYIFVSSGVKQIRTAKIFLDKPSSEDETLYPSDHVGLISEIEI
jgi:endonuclease/exonuclease/phosphatase family metal-dependent hydrolase